MQTNVRLSAFRDVALIIGASVAVQAAVFPFSWKFASLPAAATVLILATIFLRQQNLGWRDVGLKGPSSARGVFITLGQTVITLAVMIAVGAIASIVLGQYVEPTSPAGDRFEGIVGNLDYYLMWLAISWIVGGFAEEMVFRGFLINRVESFLTGRVPIEKSGIISIIAVILPAALFGFAHIYWRGLLGALVGTCVGIALGILYLAYGRRLWPLILAHGLLNTLSVTARYFDADI